MESSLRCLLLVSITPDPVVKNGYKVVSELTLSVTVCLHWLQKVKSSKSVFYPSGKLCDTKVQINKSSRSIRADSDLQYKKIKSLIESSQTVPIRPVN